MNVIADRWTLEGAGEVLVLLTDPPEFYLRQLDEDVVVRRVELLYLRDSLARNVYLNRETEELYRGIEHWRFRVRVQKPLRLLAGGELPEIDERAEMCAVRERLWPANACRRCGARG